MQFDIIIFFNPMNKTWNILVVALFLFLGLSFIDENCLLASLF